MVFGDEGDGLARWTVMLLSGIAMDAVHPAAKTIPEVLFAIYPDDFRGDRCRAGGRVRRGPDAVFVLCRFRCRLVHAGLHPALLLGVGRRISMARRGCSISPAALSCISAPVRSRSLVAAAVIGRRQGYGTEKTSRLMIFPSR